MQKSRAVSWFHQRRSLWSHWPYLALLSGLVPFYGFFNVIHRLKFFSGLLILQSPSFMPAWQCILKAVLLYIWSCILIVAIEVFQGIYYATRMSSHLFLCGNLAHWVSAQTLGLNWCIWALVHHLQAVRFEWASELLCTFLSFPQ